MMNILINVRLAKKMKVARASRKTGYFLMKEFRSTPTNIIDRYNIYNIHIFFVAYGSYLCSTCVPPWLEPLQDVWADL